MGPLYKFGLFGFVFSLQLAVLIGFCFGLLLERAGFGNPRKLTAVFYLRDFAVLKVMFTAIVVCMLGLIYFSVFNWIDLSSVYLLPTYVLPQIVGGFVLGVGFVMGGYCPTTSIIATVSGKLDGLVFIFGIMFGSFVFAEIFPFLKNFYSAGDMGSIRLSDVLKINSGLIALLVTLLAVGTFWFVEKLENRFGEKDKLVKGSGNTKVFAAVLLVLLGLVLAIIKPDLTATKRPPIQVKPQNKVEEIQKIAPKAEEPSSSTFKIEDDEGC
ncbi:MAG TPA: sulfurtransferase [Desulfobacteraceae bacterium]|nr:sulfurtransferase [Desulfobacteraceae bacterium]